MKLAYCAWFALVSLFIAMENAVASSICECGQDRAMTVDQRIQDCSRCPGSTKVSTYGNKSYEWNLVARKAKEYQFFDPYEVWLDKTSGLVWGDMLSKRYTHAEAVTLGTDCKEIFNGASDCNVISENACDSADAEVPNAGITDRKFGVMSELEFQVAQTHGWVEVLPSMYNYEYVIGKYTFLYWTKTLFTDAANQAICPNGSGFGYRCGLDYKVPVRCVGRLAQ